MTEDIAHCPYCSGPLLEPSHDSEDGHWIGECSEDHIGHHLFCWKEFHGCTTLNCPNEGGSDITRQPRALVNLRRIESKEIGLAREALKRLESAIAQQTDELIVRVWIKDRILLEKLPDELRPHLLRIHHAEETLAILNALREALQTKDECVALSIFIREDQRLAYCPSYISGERQTLLTLFTHYRDELIRQASAFRRSENIEAMADLWKRNAELVTTPGFIPDELLQKLREAARHIQIVQDFQEAVQFGQTNMILEIFRTNKDLLISSPYFSAANRTVVMEAEHVFILKQYHNLLHQTSSPNPSEVVAAGIKALNAGFELTGLDRVAFETARRTIYALNRIDEALQAKDDFALAEIWKNEADVVRPYLTVVNLHRSELAAERIAILPRLRLALSLNQPLDVARLYSRRVFGNCDLLSPEEHAQSAQIASKKEALEALISALNRIDDEQITAIWEANPEFQSQWFTHAQQRQISEVLQRVSYSRSIRQKLDSGNALSALQEFQVALTAGLELQGLIRPQQMAQLRQRARAQELKHRLMYDTTLSLEEFVRLGEEILSTFPDLLLPDEVQAVNTAKMRLGTRLLTELENVQTK